ncbi:MAG: polysaccharide deacetylase family protein [Muribaculaceae bacterium]|nr:polysaccharide deacetylase family protein [Muribaculaceae bacterium]
MKLTGIEKAFLRVVGPWIESPPKFFRRTFLRGVFRIKDPDGAKKVYLTFDDGPIPESTPWVLDTLDRYGVKATFFMVGDNVRKYPELYSELVARGHRVGNHTMHHLDGSRSYTRRYVRDVEEADRYIESDLFRPPHGWMRFAQKEIVSITRRIIMYDVVTRDYSKYVDADRIVANVKKYARPGSIIVFHDSLKSRAKLETALPECIEWLRSEGYEFGLIPGMREIEENKKKKCRK